MGWTHCPGPFPKWDSIAINEGLPRAVQAWMLVGAIWWYMCFYFSLFFSFQFSCSDISKSLLPHGLQHTRLPCPAPTPRACSNSCPLSQWYHPTILSCLPLLLPSIFPSIRVFSNESVLRIRWPKYWSFNFSFSPFGEYSGLISFRVD